MPPGRPKEYPWYKKIADVIVRRNQSMRIACMEEGIDLDGTELDKVFKSIPFQRVLWQSRFEYYNELASHPGRTKAAALGLMVLAVQKLAEEGEWKEVLEGVLKLAKVEGWVGSDSTTNVFANLTAKDIEEARKRLEGFARSKLPATTGSLEPIGSDDASRSVN